jgi:hypothetical protein
MSVLILELGNSHIECTYTFVHLLKIKNQKIHLICNKSLFELFPLKNKLDGFALVPDDFNFISELKTIFFIRRYVIQHKINRIIFNTTEINIIRNFFIIMPSGAKSFGLFHNAKKLEIGSTVRNIFAFRMKKYFLLGNHLANNTKVISGISVLPYYPVYFPTPKKIELYKTKDELWVTIIGSVNFDRRDFRPLIDLIRKRSFKINIKFIFLGKNYYANEFKHIIDTEQWWKDHILSFDDIVDYDLFHNYVHLSDILLPLIKMKDDVTYGHQRITGSFNIGIGYRKPFLLPHHVNNEDIRPFAIYYETYDDLINIINNMGDCKDKISVIRDNYMTSPLIDFNLQANHLSNFMELT